jgi:Protein of unknown function (DUF4012)
MRKLYNSNYYQEENKIMLKKVIIIILVLLAIGAVFIAYEYTKAEGDHQILLLIVNPNEHRSVDMAFVIPMVNYDVINMTSVYPGGMYHPNATAPAEVQQQGGGERLLLHDTLWGNETGAGAKLAQETVEYNTGIKTDAVVIMTPAAIDAMIDAVGPLYVEGMGYVNSSSFNSLLNEQNLGQTRGDRLYTVMMALMETYHNPNQRNNLLLTVANQYILGNIVAIPNELFIQLAIASGINKLV